MASRTVKPRTPDDVMLDHTLRPRSWDEFIGQEKVKENLAVLIEAAKRRQEPCDHILLYGPAGLGKTTLAHLIAAEMGGNLKVTSGPTIEKAGDLASLLTNLAPGDILFIDEAHRLPNAIEEILYPALESRTLHLIVGSGATARTIELALPPFTFIAATTRIGLLSGPLRSRFGATFRLDFYRTEDIEKIIARSARLLGIAIEPDAIAILAAASRFTPRVANRLLKRARDFAEISNERTITVARAQKTLALLEIDHLGLEAADRALLRTIIEKFDGGPVGLQTLAAATGEEKDAIEELYEPYLMRLGLLERTTKGRRATRLAYQHLGIAIAPHLFPPPR
jgi:Holliday junction DNA helicase RuvB